MTDFTLTGRHVAAMFICGFGVIIGVNLLLAFSAVQTFPGLEVKNSYVASQSFDADRTAQLGLNWTVSAEAADNLLLLSIEDPAGPVEPEITRATLGRATHVRDDRELVWHFDGTHHVAAVPDLGAGNWNLRIEAESTDGTVFRQRIMLRVAK